jgi:CheY-like chemotaxis protein
MPRVNGNAVAKHIRSSERRDTPIVAITGFGEDVTTSCSNPCLSRPFCRVRFVFPSGHQETGFRFWQRQFAEGPGCDSYLTHEGLFPNLGSSKVEFSCHLIYNGVSHRQHFTIKTRTVLL